MSESAFGLWDYSDAKACQPYGDSVAYELGAEFLKDSTTVEDWGCGYGYFREVMGRVAPESSVIVIGIDGSASRFADIVVDLKDYRSQDADIFMRGVLEHNECWAAILHNACVSMYRKFVLVLFTPFVPETSPIQDLYKLRDANSKHIGLAFRKSDITKVLDRYGLHYDCQTLTTKSEFGVDIIFRVAK